MSVLMVVSDDVIDELSTMFDVDKLIHKGCTFLTISKFNDPKYVSLNCAGSEFSCVHFSRDVMSNVNLFSIHYIMSRIREQPKKYRSFNKDTPLEEINLFKNAFIESGYDKDIMIDLKDYKEGC